VSVVLWCSILYSMYSIPRCYRCKGMSLEIPLIDAICMLQNIQAILVGKIRICICIYMYVYILALAARSNVCVYVYVYIYVVYVYVYTSSEF